MEYKDLSLIKKIESTRDNLLEVQQRINEAECGMTLMDTNEPAKISVEKCIELCNCLLGNTKQFQILFENTAPPDEDDMIDEDDWDED